MCIFLQQSQFSVPSTSLALLSLCCVLDHSLVMEPVPSVHLLIGCFGKLLHAGLNNEERIKRLRGAGKERETMTIGNTANTTEISVTPVTRGDRAWGAGR